MRTFLSTHWKSLVALIILVLLALLTMPSGSAEPDLAARLRAHLDALAARQYGAPAPSESAGAARYIQATLAGEGYHVLRKQYDTDGVAMRTLEASLANVARGARPARIFIIGARFGQAPCGDENGSGTAAVLELARLLRGMHPSQGTEIKFVFSLGGAPRPSAGKLVSRASEGGSFIAFAGNREASSRVGQALAAFRAASDPPAEGLATPAYVQGVTISSRASHGRREYPALLIADTAFLRYPYLHTTGELSDHLDVQLLARVLDGLAHNIAALAGTSRS
jgi:hypothetical protein